MLFASSTNWVRLLRTLIPLFWLATMLFFSSCKEKEIESNLGFLRETVTGGQPFVVVLGIAQDAGYPQAGCQKECCREAWLQPAKRRSVSCIAIVDPIEKQAWMIDATPDFKDQLRRLENVMPGHTVNLAGIFLTHAHIGHYTGLMHLGREVMGSKKVPVHAMPRMRNFLQRSGPWSQLVRLENISLRNLSSDSSVILNDRIKVTPMPVPHRDEYSETVGYKIQGPAKSLLFIPDIDKWHLWEKDIVEEVKTTDHALLDGSFYQNGEIPGRDMSEIPHPFVVESMETFKGLPSEEKAKIQFIHFNHTNPVLLENSEARKNVLEKGFGICEEGEVLPL
ncbi:MAG: MBL fold metallo-hydrolase [Bacteroidota bacterium]